MESVAGNDYFLAMHNIVISPTGSVFVVQCSCEKLNERVPNRTNAYATAYKHLATEMEVIQHIISD